MDATPQGSTKRPFLLPVALLRAAFQGRLMRRLLQAFERGEFHRGEDWKAFPMLASKATFRGTLSALREKAWCIRIEPPFGSPQVLLRYLGRYVNRVALAPQRIVGWNKDAGTVTITWTANDDARTVSYTHLDVYKRQNHHHIISTSVPLYRMDMARCSTATHEAITKRPGM